MADRASYSFLGVRQRYFRFAAETTMRFAPVREEEAGLVVIQKESGAFSLTLRGQGGARRLVLTQWRENDHVELASQPYNGAGVRLRVRGNDLQYRFEAAAVGGAWRPVGPVLDGTLLSPAVLPGFNYTGVYIGLYGSSNGMDTDNQAVFTRFAYRPVP